MTDAGELEAIISQHVITALKAHDADRVCVVVDGKIAELYRTIHQRQPSRVGCH